MSLRVPGFAWPPSPALAVRDRRLIALAVAGATSRVARELRGAGRRRRSRRAPAASSTARAAAAGRTATATTATTALRPAAAGARSAARRARSSSICADGTVSRPHGRDGGAARSTSAHASWPAAGTGRSFTDATVDGVHLRVLTVGDGRRRRGPGRPSADRGRVARSTACCSVLAALAAAGVALAALLGALVARAALAPITRFTRRTEALSSPTPTCRTGSTDGGRDELGRLARSFNGALAALESSVEAQRHLVEDASHELRTPIASLRANIQTLEHADRLPAEDQRAAARRHRRRARRADGADRRHRRAGPRRAARRGASTRCASTCRRRRLRSRRAARRRRPSRSDRDLPETVVRGDPERVARAVSNVHRERPQVVAARRRRRRRARRRRARRARPRPGFAADDLPHVFDRFYRSSEARGTPGSGLGPRDRPPGRRGRRRRRDGGERARRRCRRAAAVRPRDGVDNRS